MKKNISSKLALVLCLLALFSCKSKKHLLVDRKADTATVSPSAGTSKTVILTNGDTVTKSVTVTVPINVPPQPVDNFKLEKLKAIRLKQTDFTTFSGKASAKLNVNGDSHDVTVNIRIKKGQQIWVSITAVLGVEVARAFITPDSIKIMNRLETTYLKKPFSYVYGYTSKQINYKTIESLLIGNAVGELVNDNSVMNADNGNVILSGNLDDLIYALTVGPDLRVTQTNMSNQIAGQSIHVFNAAFIQVGAYVIPSKINISSASGAKNIQAELHYTKTEFDQILLYPFTVPARFTLVD